MSNIKDKTGLMFGRLLVLGDSGRRNVSREVYWTCRCECGKIVEVSSGNLTRAQSCGCLRKEILAPIIKSVGHKNKKNIMGQVFGRLLVVSECSERTKHRDVVWLCKCECGNHTRVTTTALVRGYTRSCGCLVSEVASRRNKLRSHPKGAESPLWKGGTYHSDRDRWKARAGKIWKKSVFDKYGYTCPKCGEDDASLLQTHHIFPWQEFPELRNDTENGRVICKECHILFHHLYGTQGVGEIEWDDFLNWQGVLKYKGGKMPIHRGYLNKKPGYKWGKQGKCYTYTPGDKESRERAREKARRQGRAVEASKE